MQRMYDRLEYHEPMYASNEEVFCIAYGSNLDEKRMKSRCPNAEFFGTSVILGYRLLFKKSCTGYYATIEQDANCEVPVVVYRMTAGDEVKLDRFEGYPRYYYKREFLLPIWGPSGRKKRKRRSCIAYVLHENRELGCPTDTYYDLIDSGYERWGFDKQWLHKALSDSIGAKPAKAWLKEYESHCYDYFEKPI